MHKKQMVVATPQSAFSAEPSALGYLYQFIFALNEAASLLSEDSSFTVGIETLDDISLTFDNNLNRLYQTKRHSSSGATVIGDKSVDLWKTLRIWIKEQLPNITTKNIHLFFVTTDKCKENSSLYFIKHKKINDAIKSLNDAAISSKNKKNEDAYSTYLELDISQKIKLIESISVIDESGDFNDIHCSLKKTLYHAVNHNFLDSLVKRLEQWWLLRVLEHLNSSPKIMIYSDEIQGKLDQLRDQLKSDSLPLDQDILNAEVNYDDFINMNFTKQLNIINCNSSIIVQAMKNYYRAATLRSQWMRENLLYFNELKEFDDKLFREWETLFSIMEDICHESADEAEKILKGKSLYHGIQNMTPQLRPGMTDSVVARGSYHILSDELRIGWHVNFREILK